jgi:O-antigen ligase
VSQRATTRAWTVGSPIVGVFVFATSATWAAVTAGTAGSSAWPTVGLILMSGSTVALCWILSLRRPLLVPTAIIGVTAALLATHWGATFDYDPRHGLVGYANAAAALLVQASIAALILVAIGASRAARVGGLLAVVVFVSALIFTRSWTAVLVTPVVLLLALLVERTHGGRAAVVVCAGLFGVVLVSTLVLGASGLGTGAAPIDRAIQATLSEQRVTLWREALSLTAREPLLGVGPGRFALTSPTASSDEDLRWAHNEFLQVGAESGIPGYVFAVSIFVWGFAALWLAAPTAITVLAACALAIIGIHACVDYVLHFPTVVLAGAAILGTSLGAYQDDEITAVMPSPYLRAGWPV